MAEEKKNQTQKLTYEQLEAYANQTTIQANRMIKERKELVEEIKRLRDQTNFAEISMAFKVLEFRDCFDPTFVSKVINRLQEVLTPEEENKKLEEPEKKE